MASGLLYGAAAQLRDALLPVLATLTVAAAAAPALADPAAAPEPIAPVFPTLGADGLDRSIHARIHAAGLVDPEVDPALWGVELGGQAVAPSGWGGYGAVRLSRRGGTSALGAPEVGLIYRAMASGGATTFRAGLSVGTDPDRDVGEQLTTIFDVGSRRPADLIRTASGTTAVRLAIAPMLHEGTTTVRGDFGVDLPVREEGSAIDAIAHGDFAAAVRRGSTAFVAEVQNAVLITSGESETIHVVAGTVELLADRATVSFTVSRAFGWDDEADDELFDAIGLELGVRGTL